MRKISFPSKSVNLYEAINFEKKCPSVKSKNTLKKNSLTNTPWLTEQYSVVFSPRYDGFQLKPTKHYKSMAERVCTSLSAFSKSVDELSKGFS